MNRSIPAPRRALALGLLAATLCACAPGIEVTRLQPSRFNLGSTRRVAVLQVTARPRAQAIVLTQLQEQIVNRRFYKLINAVNRGLSITVTAAGTNIDVGSIRQQVDADVYLNANVLRFDVRTTQHQETEYDHGKKYQVAEYRPEAHVRINFQVVKANGEVLVLRDYRGEDDGAEYKAGESPSESREDLLEGAVRQAVAGFLGDITPRQVVEKIELDEDDPALKPGVNLASHGDLAGAEQAWRAVLAQNPNNAGAIYDVGVLLETRGDFDQAAANYKHAFELRPKSLYRDALQDLNRRLSDAQALQQKI